MNHSPLTWFTPRSRNCFDPDRSSSWRRRRVSMSKTRTGMVASVVLLSLAAGGCGTVQQYQQHYFMTFFVTSTGSGKGADFGGLSGADGHCQALATAVG